MATNYCCLTYQTKKASARSVSLYARTARIMQARAHTQINQQLHQTQKRTVAAGVEDDEEGGRPEPVEGRRHDREEPHAPGQGHERQHGAADKRETPRVAVDDLRTQRHRLRCPFDVQGGGGSWSQAVRWAGDGCRVTCNSRARTDGTVGGGLSRVRDVDRFRGVSPTVGSERAHGESSLMTNEQQTGGLL